MKSKPDQNNMADKDQRRPVQEVSPPDESAREAKAKRQVKLESCLEKSGDKTADYEVLWNKYLRLHADFDNTRKRWDRERGEILQFANFQLISEVIVILDELEQAVRVGKEHNTDPQMVKGLEMTCEKFRGILEKRGLKPIKAKAHKFDPHLHEIVAQREVEREDEHIVLEEIQTGYLFRDKLLRTAKVIVNVKKQSQAVPHKSPEEEPPDTGRQAPRGNLSEDQDAASADFEKEKTAE